MSRKILSTTLVDSVLPAHADSVEGIIQSVKKRYSLANRLIADSLDLSLLRLSDQENSAELILFLQEKTLELGAKNVGIVSLETDTYYDSLGQIYKLDYSSDRDKWVQEFLDSPEMDRYSLYDPDNNEELYSFFFDSKIVNAEGKVTAIFGTGIALNNFSFNTLTSTGKTRILFADREGTLRLPLYTRGTSFFDEYNLRDSSKGFTEQSLYLSEREDSTLMLYVRFIPEIDRYLIIEHNITEAYKDLQHQSFATLALGMVFSLILVMINHVLVSRAGKKLSIKGYTDPLTESYNRHFLDEYFERNIRDDQNISLLTLDIDHFKLVNDTQGHLAGDLILKTVSSITKSQIRGDDFIVRWGGDEFIIVVHAGLQRTLDISERIRLKIEQETTVTVTIGVTELTKFEDFTAALSRADDALYAAKHEGRNKVLSTD